MPVVSGISIIWNAWCGMLGEHFRLESSFKMSGYGGSLKVQH